MVVAADGEVAAGPGLRQYGWAGERVSLPRGMNSRLDELQAALLRVGLRHLDEDNGIRRAIAARYLELRPGTIVSPKIAPGAQHVYHQYVVRTARRDALRASLARDGIGTAVHYPKPVHLQPAYVGILPGAADLPNTERVAGEILSLPMFPGLEATELARVCAAIASWAGVAG